MATGLWAKAQDKMSASTSFELPNGDGTFLPGDVMRLHVVDNEDQLDALKRQNERVCILCNVDRLSMQLGKGLEGLDSASLKKIYPK